MAELPTPPVPADADLTDFKFMPLEVGRLRRSKAWLICKRKPELAFYMLNLWTASWHERPAGSLEDDDDVLADAAMCSPDKWPKVRADAMRGWVKHADGRLYHPVVAEKVMDSYHGKAVARWSKECDRIRKENHKRKENKQEPLPFPQKPDRKAVEFQTHSAGIPPEKPLKGEGRDRDRDRDREREGIGKGDSSLSAAASSRNTAREPMAEAPKAAAAPENLDDLAPPEFLRRARKPRPIPIKPTEAMDQRKPVDEAYRLWLELARDIGIPDAGYLNSDRRQALTDRLREVGDIEGWKLFLEKVRAAGFLRKPTGEPKFWVGLSKLLEPEHFSKILEDRYAEHHERSGDADERSNAAALAGIAEAGSR